MFNYHDLGHLGVDRAQMNRARVRCARSRAACTSSPTTRAAPGTGISESGTLHRIEEAFLRARGRGAPAFSLLAEAQFLRNPADPRDKNTPEPPQPKDEFVLKFVKP